MVEQVHLVAALYRPASGGQLAINIEAGLGFGGEVGHTGLFLLNAILPTP